MAASSASRLLSVRAAPLRITVSAQGMRCLRILLWVAAGLAGTALLVAEGRTSWLQSSIFSAVDRQVSFSIQRGHSSAIIFPGNGPWDERLGYSQIPQFVRRSQPFDYTVTAQARDSTTLRLLTRLGMYPIYPEKIQSGLAILDRNNQPMVDFRYPRRVYRRFSEIPPLVVNTLLFIENRQLFDPAHPHQNPAVEWSRLSRAALEYGFNSFNRHRRTIGGSTLATQLEKMRHSPSGLTHSPTEKLNQMLSASLRAYQNGRDTRIAQERIVRDYLNSLPLAATPASGEVIGLGDGLWAWYSESFEQTNELLATAANDLDPNGRQRQATAFRQVLSLLIATRSPQRYLATSSGDLVEETNRYLRALCNSGLINRQMRDLALQGDASIRRAPAAPEPDYIDTKVSNYYRASLSTMLGLHSTYALDRLDLSIRTTIDLQAQRSVTAFLRGATGADPGAVASLRQTRLLAQSDPRDVIYSFTLFERSSGINLLRVQTDTLNQPLDINQGTKLELGSTAKLRTIILYLQIIEQLHGRYSSRGCESAASDPLTAWACAYLSAARDNSLQLMLEAALDRRYSASPAEGFFTAGGLHQFQNFERSDNRRICTVREAFERSVNLVFIRLMRDIERYYLARLPEGTGAAISAADRQKYLVQFADQEGTVYLGRFFRQYRGLSVESSLDKLGNAEFNAARRLTVIYRTVLPRAPLADLTAYLHKHALPGLVSEKYVASLYETYAPDKFNLQDRGYLAGVHPLELWLLSYKAEHPQASLSEMVRASTAERQHSYAWLFRPNLREAQDTRIRIVQEQEAFRQISQEWQRLGYPFETLVPSYATAIGVSGDTPSALAELMGIIANRGMRYPAAGIREMHFAQDTPFDTLLNHSPGTGRRVLSEAISDLVHRELIQVVERGTARRAAGGISIAGKALPLGGKTGTGDNRLKMYGGHGYLIGSRVVNRTAVFAFIIGDRFYGTVMAFVPGSAAGQYEFTSALAVQIFKDLEPSLKPLLQR